MKKSNNFGYCDNWKINNFRESKEAKKIQNNNIARSNREKKTYLCFFHFRLDFTVGIIDDGKEHVEENEENEEDVEEEESRTKEIMSSLKTIKIIVLPSNHSFFQYCDSNIGLFSIASCKVITLNPFCILSGIGSLLLF